MNIYLIYIKIVCNSALHFTQLYRILHNVATHFMVTHYLHLIWPSLLYTYILHITHYTMFLFLSIQSLICCCVFDNKTALFILIFQYSKNFCIISTHFMGVIFFFILLNTTPACPVYD